ncbi:MAG: hypothetical protein M3P44_17150 [Actinomycetota bacterium]|nr:hypothetical protein [Actinomycetota bacterium]
MGHSDVRTTMNIYGHLLPGDETEHGAQLEAFLERADTASRLAQLDTVPTI